MSIFAILTTTNNGPLEAAITEQFAGEHFKVRPGQWLLSFRGTAKELSDTLRITDGTNGTAVVLNISGYFGRANPAIWEWIRTKWSGPNG